MPMVEKIPPHQAPDHRQQQLVAYGLFFHDLSRNSALRSLSWRTLIPLHPSYGNTFNCSRVSPRSGSEALKQLGKPGRPLSVTASRTSHSFNNHKSAACIILPSTGSCCIQLATCKGDTTPTAPSSLYVDFCPPQQEAKKRASVPQWELRAHSEYCTIDPMSILRFNSRGDLGWRVCEERR